MTELARTLVSRLRAYLGNRRGARRFSTSLPIRVTSADRQLTANGAGNISWLDGHTSDLSTSGIGLNVAAIRIGEHYLVGENRHLRVVLELPTGPIELEVTPVRYESISEEDDIKTYIIGARITGMSDDDLKSYGEYLNRLTNHAPLD